MIGEEREFKPDTETEDGRPAFTAETIIYGLLEVKRSELLDDLKNSDQSWGAKMFRRELVYELQEYLEEMDKKSE